MSTLIIITAKTVAQNPNPNHGFLKESGLTFENVQVARFGFLWNDGTKWTLTVYFVNAFDGEPVIDYRQEFLPIGLPAIRKTIFGFQDRGIVVLMTETDHKAFYIESLTYTHRHCSGTLKQRT